MQASHPNIQYQEDSRAASANPVNYTKTRAEPLEDTVEQSARRMAHLLIKTLGIYKFSVSLDRCHSCNPFCPIGAERGDYVPCESTCKAAWAPAVCRSDGDTMLGAIDSCQ